MEKIYLTTFLTISALNFFAILSGVNYIYRMSDEIAVLQEESKEYAGLKFEYCSDKIKLIKTMAEFPEFCKYPNMEPKDKRIIIH